jgi:hypothetical protein
MASRRILAIALVASWLVAPGTAVAQELGDKVPGSTGIDSGVQSKPGLLVGDRLGWYASNQARDQNGNVLPLKGFDLDVVANSFGANLTLRGPLATYLSATFAAPLAKISLNSNQPLTDVDRFGVGDFYLMPLQLGWLLGHFDVVTSYAIYIPSGRFEAAGGKGVSSGQVTNEFSLGGAVFFDREKRSRFSAMASYDLEGKKKGIDITRGDTITIQGGAGTQFSKVLDIGLAGYALWQVQDDRGADLPDALRGGRTRGFGLGPEAGWTISAIRTKVTARYEWDLGARARPMGRVLFIGAAFQAWAPG